MKFDATQLLEALLALCAALITGYVIPWIKSRTTENQQTVLVKAVRLAVRAAEQLYGSKTGKEKKQYVLSYLKEKGIAVDDTYIEGIVNEYFGGGSATGAAIIEYNSDNTLTEG